MPNFDDLWSQLLGAAETEAANQAAVSVPAGNSFEKGALLLDTYRIESDALHGGMGDVWRVRHTGWDTDLAMKRPKPEYFTAQAQKQGFIDECKNWINLGLHPNIVSCYYVREIDGVPAIFSEWMENGDLEHHIQKGTLYDGTEEELQVRLLDIAIQYARGLHYAHEQGLIHQDVKPANLLLTNDWQAKAADFGLANARAQLTVLEGDLTQLDAGQSLNAAAGGYTPAYCSMEQMDGRVLTRRTDIYSWAVSVMEMYIGSRPWQNGVVAGAGCRDYMAETRVKIPEALQDLLAECMAMDADDRPHDFAVVEERLKQIYKDAAGSAYPRPEPRAAADTADSLNNRALSALDLGEPAEAERFWDEALKADPYFAEAVYNRGLYRWRTGRITDPQLAAELEQLGRNSGRSAELYLSAVRSEQGTAARLSVDDAPAESCGVFAGAPLYQLQSRDGSRRLIRERGSFVLADRSGRELHRYKVPELDYACAVSGDGNTVFYAYRDSDVRLYIHCPDAGTEQSFPIQNLPRLAEANALAVSPDGSRIFVGMDIGIVVVLDRSGRELARHKLDKWLTCMGADPETGRVAAGAHSLYIFSPDGQLLRKFCGHGTKVVSVFLRGRRLVSATAAWTGIWDTETGQCLLSVKSEGADFWKAAWLEDGDRLRIVHEDELTEFEVSEGRQKAAFAVSRPQTAAARTDSDARFDMLCAEAEKLIDEGRAADALRVLEEARQIDGYERNPRRTDLNERAGRLCRRRGVHAVFSNPADTAVLGSPSNIFRACFAGDMQSVYLKKDTNEIDSGTVARLALPSWELAAESKAYSIGALMCEGGGFVAVAGLYGAVHLLDAKTMERIHSFDYPMRTAPRMEVTAMCCAGDRYLAVSRVNGNITVFSLSERKMIRTIEAGLGEEAVLDISADETRLLAADSESRTIRVWQLPSGEESGSVRAGGACLGAGAENVRDVGIAEARFTDDPNVILFSLDVPAVLSVGGRYMYADVDPCSALCRINLKTGAETLIPSLIGVRKLAPAAGRSWWAGVRSGTVVLFSPDDPSAAYSFEPVPKEYSTDPVLFPSVSPDGRYLLATGVIRRRNGVIRKWEIDWIYES